MKLYKYLRVILIIAALPGCQKPHTTLPLWFSNITKSRVWTGTAYKTLESAIGGSNGSEAYSNPIINPEIKISTINSTTLKVSVWDVNLTYSQTDSNNHAIVYAYSSNAGNFNLTYNYAGDSILLNNYSIVGSEYGYDDPYEVGSYFTGK